MLGGRGRYRRQQVIPIYKFWWMQEMGGILD